MAGVFTTSTVIVVAVAVAIWVRLLLKTECTSVTPGSARTTLGVLAFVAVMTGLGLVSSTEHYLSDRDPGVYLLTAANLAETGRLPLEAPAVAIDGLSDLGWSPMGFSTPAESGESFPQFVHLLPSLIAIGNLFGGEEVAFRVTPLLSGMVLLGMYALARRLVADRWAAVAVVMIGISLPFIHFGRDAHSEILVLVLVLAALLLTVREPRSGPAGPLADFTVGLLIGALFAARVDAMLFAPAVALIAVAKPLRRALLVVGGAAISTAVGLVDLEVFSPEYAEALRELRGQAWLAGGLLTIAALGLWMVQRSDRLNQLLVRAAPIAAVGATTAVLGLWLIRPRIGDVHRNENGLVGALQGVEGVPVVPTLNYAEESVARLGWYLGPLVLVLAALGAGFVVAQVLRGRNAGDALRDRNARDRWLLPLVTLGVPVLVYLWRPSISPDQPWAMRRQLLALVLFALLAVVSLDRLDRFLTDRWGSWRWVQILVVLAVVAAPVRDGLPLLTSKSQSPVDEDLAALCTSIGPDAIVVLLPGLLVEQHYPLALRRYCGVPAFSGPAADEFDYGALAATVAAQDQNQNQDRRLVLVGSADDHAERIGTGAEELSMRMRGIELTIERQPTEEVEWTRQLVVWVVGEPS